MRKVIFWAVVECYKALLAAQEARTDDRLVGTVPQLASIRAAVEKLEISQLDMQAAFLKGLLTSDDLIPIKPPPRIAEQKISENNIVVWTRREMPKRLVDVVVNEEMVFRRCGASSSSRFNLRKVTATDGDLFQSRHATQVYAKSTFMSSPRLRGLLGTNTDGGDKNTRSTTTSKLNESEFPRMNQQRSATPVTNNWRYSTN